MNRDRLVAAARLGGDYLVRMQMADGRFRYSYNPVTNQFSKLSYNILRHAGAAISLFDLYSATRDTRYLKAATKAVVYLKTRLRRANKAGLLVPDHDGKAKLGANGLALIAFVRYIELTGSAQARAQAVGLARLIMAMQASDGSFKSYYAIRGHPASLRVSLYYPGEAILGLLRLYNLTRDSKLLDAARRGADYLIKSQQSADDLPPDAWLIQALEQLYKIGHEPRYASHAIDLAEAMIADQYTIDDGSERAGAFRPGEPRATPAASRAEGLVASYRLARATGDARAGKIAEALRAAARFQMSQQYTAQNSAQLANPAVASGGFRESLTSPRIRIDFVQHNISSLLAVADALY